MADVKFEFQGEAGGLLSTIKTLKDELNSLKEAAAATKREVQGSFQSAASGANDYKAEVDKLLKTNSDHKQTIDQLNKKMAELAQSERNAAGAASEQAKKVDELKRKLAEQSAAASAAGKATEDLGKKTEVTAQSTTKMGKGVEGAFRNISGSLRAMVTSIGSLGIIAILAGIGKALFDSSKRYLEFKKAIDEGAVAQKVNTEIAEQASTNYIEQGYLIEDLIKRSKEHGLTKEQEAVIVREYNATFGETIGFANELAEVTELLTTKGAAYVEILKQQAFEQAGLALAVEKSKAALAASMKPMEDYMDIIDGAELKVRKFLGLDYTHLAQQAAKYRDKEVKENEVAAGKAIEASRRAGAAAIDLQRKFGITATKSEIDNNKKVEQERRRGIKSEESQRRSAARRQESEAKAAAKRRAAEAKKNAEELLRLQKELAKAEVDLIEDTTQKEIAAENLKYKEKVDDLNRKKGDATAEQQKVINKLLEKEQLIHNANMLAIQVKYYDDVQSAFDAANKATADITQSDLQKSIGALNDQYRDAADGLDEYIKVAKKYNETFNTDTFDVSELEGRRAELDKKYAKEREKIITDYKIKAIDKEEELALAQMDILQKSGVSQEALEKVKEAGKLNIVIEYAKKRLAILEAQGGQENQLQILQLKKAIQDAQKGLKEISDKSTFSLWGLLGLGQDDEKRVQEYVSIIGDSFNAFASLYDSLIRMRQKNIDSIQEEIDAQMDLVEKENELAEQGYANNVDLEKRRLAELQARKRQEEDMLNSALKKKQAMQKAEIISDGIVQVNNLITASSDIMKWFAKIPYVGVPLGIAMIATMFAGFLAAKASAFNAVNSQQYAEGGVAGGKRHSQGGNKYISTDGNDSIEIEQGEWVVNRRSSKKYDPILQAINNDSLSEMSRPQLRKLLKPYGITLSDEVKGGINSAPSKAQTIVVNDSNNWDKQNEILSKIESNTKGSRVDYGDYVIERVGNIVRKVKKKK